MKIIVYGFGAIVIDLGFYPMLINGGYIFRHVSGWSRVQS